MEVCQQITKRPDLKFVFLLHLVESADFTLWVSTLVSFGGVLRGVPSSSSGIKDTSPETACSFF